MYVGDEDRKYVHSDRFPIDFRALLVGASGCGKACLLMRLLLEHNLLNYNKLYVFARTLYQPQYQTRRAGMENELPKQDIIQLLNSQQIIKCEETSIDEVAKGLRIDNNENGITPSGIEAEFYDTGSNIPDPSELDRSQRTLIVFDDVMTDRSQKENSGRLLYEVEVSKLRLYIFKSKLHTLASTYDTVKFELYDFL